MRNHLDIGRYPGCYTALDVLEQIDFDEYLKLSAPDEHLVDLVLSVGFVNLEKDGRTRVTLAELFPVGTATNAALSKFLGSQL